MRYLTVLILLILTIPIIGQEAEDNTRTYISYDGWLSFEYPSDWLVGSETDDFGLGFFTVGNTISALQTLSNNPDQEENSPLAPGEIGIIIARPSYLSQLFSFTEDTTPIEALETFLTGDFTGVEFEEVIINGNPAAILETSDETSAGMAIGIEFAPGVQLILFASSTPDSFPEFEDDVMLIAETMSYGGLADYILEHQTRINGADWSPDGTKFVTTESDINSDPRIFTVNMWDAETGELLYSIPGQNADWSADGSKLLVSGGEAPTRVLDPETGDELVSFKPVFNADWNEDESLIITGIARDEMVEVWEAETGERIFGVQTQGTRDFELLFDETVLQTTYRTFSGTDPGSIQFWDMADGELILALNDIDDVNFNAAGTQIIGSVEDKTLKVWSYPEGEELFSYDVEGEEDLPEVEQTYFYSPAFRFDDTVISANVSSYCSTFANSCDRSLWLWDAETGEIIFQTPEDTTYFRISWLANNHALMVANDEPVVEVWDMETREIIATFDRDSRDVFMMPSFDSSRLLVRDNNIVTVRDMETYEPILRLPHDVELNTAFWVNDGQWILTRTDTATLTVWDAETGSELLRLGHGSRMMRDGFAAAFWNDDFSQAVSFASGTTFARLWDAETLINERLASYADLNTLLATGADQFRNGQLIDALHTYNEILQIDPDNTFIYNDRAVVNYNIGFVQSALSDLTVAIDLDPEYLQAIRNRADIQRFEGNLGEAINDYNLYLAIEPDNPTVINFRGVSYANSNRYEDALLDFERVVELDPEFAIAHSNIGYMHYFLGNAEEALAAFGTYTEIVGEDQVPDDVLSIIAELEASS